MQNKLLISLSIMTVLTLTGCVSSSPSVLINSGEDSNTTSTYSTSFIDDTTTSIEVTSSDSNTSVDKDFDFELLNKSIETAAAGNFSVTDLFFNTTTYWSSKAMYSELLKYGMFDLPTIEGDIGVYKYTYDETSGDVVVGEAIEENSSFQDENYFKEITIGSINKETCTIVNSNEIILNEDLEKIFYKISEYAGYAEYADYYNISLILNGDGSFKIIASAEGSNAFESEITNIGTTSVEPAETFVTDYIPAPIE